MAIKTPANLTPPPNSVEPQGDGVKLYRILERHVTDDGQGEVNFADTVDKLNDPNSGEAINVNIVSDFPNAIDNFSELTEEGRTVLFEANFDSGFDTLHDWTCIFDDGVVQESRNASDSSVNGSFSAEITSSRLSMQVAADGAARSTIIHESKNYIKISSSGITYVEGQGIFDHSGSATTNTTDFGIFQIGQASTSQSQWNIDTFLASDAGTPKNPSNITLDFTKVQTAVLEYSGKNKGDIKLGFLVDNVLYFGHVFKIDNNVESTASLNLPIRSEIVVTEANQVFRAFGLYNSEGGFSFGSTMDTTNDPSLLVQQYLNSVVCYTVGADPVKRATPFVAGNKETYKVVDSADVPLFSIQCSPTFSGVDNRTVYNFDMLQVNSSSQDENFGCYIKILYNATLEGVTDFVSLPGNSESALTVDFGATSVSGGVELFSTYIMANKLYEFFAKNVFRNYRDEFSRNSIIGENVTAKVLNQTLTVVASPMQGTISTTSIDVSANIFGGEIG